jgi:hypothetical protein
MSNSPGPEQIRSKYELLNPYLNEKTRRIWAAAESVALGRGGVSQVAEATGISRTTIYSGMRDLTPSAGQLTVELDEIRHRGGGRKCLTDLDATLTPLSRGHRAVDYGRLWRKQWQSRSIMETEIARTSRYLGPHDSGVPFSARYQ